MKTESTTSLAGVAAVAPCSAGAEFAEGHRLGYEAGLKAGSLPDGEVARVLLPLGVTALSKVADGLGKHFGDDLRMMQRGDWLIFIKPNVQEMAGEALPSSSCSTLLLLASWSSLLRSRDKN